MARRIPTVVRVANEYRKAIAAGDRAQQIALAGKFLRVQRGLEAHVEDLAAQVAKLQEAGETVSKGMLYRLDRWKALDAQLERRLNVFAVQAAKDIGARQGDLLSMGAQAGWDTLKAAGATRVPLAGLPTEALQAMIGYAGDGTPLNALLTASYKGAADAIADKLIAGVALGKGPATVAAEMVDVSKMPLDRAFVIARTEEMRPFREANLEQMDSAGVTQYQRLETLDELTCIGCLTADGEVMETQDGFDAHPCCRGTGVPIVGERPVFASRSEDWFQDQDKATQEAIMGPGRLALYDAGDAKWSDMWTKTSSETWGGAIVPTPIYQLTGGETPNVTARGEMPEAEAA